MDHGKRAQMSRGMSPGRRLWAHCGVGVLLVAAMLLAATGCTMGPKFKKPEVRTAQQWRELGRPQYVGQPVDNVEWWKNLNDPILNTLIDQAFKENPSLQAAALRVVQARVARGGAFWIKYLPLLAGSGSVSHSDFSTNVAPEVSVDLNGRQRRLRPDVRNALKDSLPSVKITPELDMYDAGFDALWEVDLWGQKRQLMRATTEQMEAAYAGYDMVMVSLAAEVARTYVDIRTLDQRLLAARSVLATMDQFTSTTEERFKNKETLITDVKLAQLLAGVVKSSIPPLESARRQLENSLCVLLGKAPQDLEQSLGASGAIPVAPLQSMVGIPADLLRRRPDVRMAEHEAAAQCARVGMAKANIMPSFSIFGSIGLRSSGSGDFFESDSVRSAYGGLVKVTNLISYPFTVENVRNQDAQFEEALLNYRNAVLNANLEVENSMYSFLKTQDKVLILEANVQTAQEAANLTMTAYKEGKVIISVPLAALTFLATQQDQMWAWRGNSATDYVAIYKALGGGWQNRVDQELVPESIREKMKQEADWWSFLGKHNLSTVQDKQVHGRH